MLHKFVILGLVLSLCGCGGSGGGGVPSASSVSSNSSSSSSSSSSINSSAASSTSNAFASVDVAAQQAYSDEGIDGLGVAIFNAQGEKVFEKMYGNFAYDKRVSIASASKVVSGLTIFRLIDQGYLSLDSTTGQLLGWQGVKGTITLRHLLSFTSGLDYENLCTYSTNMTLAQCVNLIGLSDMLAAPGEEFNYGSTHLAVAGRMAEVATGKKWNELFQFYTAAPLGLPSDLRYFAQPKAQENADNPLIAGGLRVSMKDYEVLLHMVFNKGKIGDQTFISAGLMDAQSKAPYPNARINNTPSQNPNLRYGLTAWLECDTPATGCDGISSPGAFGFTPWVDRKTGYYAILGMEYDTVKHVQFGQTLEAKLKPLIVDAIKQLP